MGFLERGKPHESTASTLSCAPAPGLGGCQSGLKPILAIVSASVVVSDLFRLHLRCTVSQTYFGQRGD